MVSYNSSQLCSAASYAASRDIKRGLSREVLVKYSVHCHASGLLCTRDFNRRGSICIGSPWTAMQAPIFSTETGLGPSFVVESASPLGKA